MNNKFLLSIKKHTDTFIEQTKTKPEETLEFQLAKQLENLYFSPPINLFEYGKWLFGVNSFEAIKPVFNITNESHIFFQFQHQVILILNMVMSLLTS